MGFNGARSLGEDAGAAREVNEGGLGAVATATAAAIISGAATVAAGATRVVW